eukprot:14169502-Ditylum_brightwellii.AAC.1
MFIESLDKYASFDGTFHDLPIGVKKKSTRETKVQRIMQLFPKLLVLAHRKAVKSVGDKVSYERLAAAMTKVIPNFAPYLEPPPI